MECLKLSWNCEISHQRTTFIIDRDIILRAWVENFVWKCQNYFPPKSTDPTHKLLAKGKAVLLSFHPPFEWAKITIACSWSNHNMWISNNNILPLNWKYLKLEQCFWSYHIMIIFLSWLWLYPYDHDHEPLKKVAQLDRPATRFSFDSHRIIQFGKLALSIFLKDM